MTGAYLGTPRRRPRPRASLPDFEEIKAERDARLAEVLAPEAETEPEPEPALETAPGPRWEPSPEVAQRREANAATVEPDESTLTRLLARRANAEMDRAPWQPSSQVAAKRADYLAEHPEVAGQAEEDRLARLVARREVDVPEYPGSAWGPSAGVAVKRGDHPLAAIGDAASVAPWVRLGDRRELNVERAAGTGWDPSEGVAARRATDAVVTDQPDPNDPVGRLANRRAAADAVQASGWQPSPEVAARRAAYADEQAHESDSPPDPAGVVERLTRRREVQ